MLKLMTPNTSFILSQDDDEDISLEPWEDETDSNLPPSGSNPTNGRLTGPAQPEKGEPSKAVNGKEEDESWEAHLGSNQDPLTSILIR